MDRTVANLHCISDVQNFGVVYPFQLFHTFFMLFCTGGQMCPMPFGAPESESHTILYIREIALFWDAVNSSQENTELVLV